MADKTYRLTFGLSDGSEKAVAFTAPQGETGKTAYEYAVDGGYTGTEEEFAAKLAEEDLCVSVTEAEDGTYSADATVEEIKAAFQAHRNVYCRVEIEEVPLQMPLVACFDDSGYSYAMFNSLIESELFFVVIDSESNVYASASSITPTLANLTIQIGKSTVTYNGTISKVLNVQSLKNPNALTINGTAYDGSEAVDVTDTINALIEAQLGVIENGAY